VKITSPDINVLLAIRAAGHVHHTSAWKWFEERDAGSVAIGRVTQMGLLRLLTNPKVLPSEVRSVPQAWDAVNEMRSDKRVFFQSEPAELETIWAALMKDPSVGPSSWTDAYLAAFAQGHGYEIVTFDRGFRRWRELTLRLLV
jgi:toxin-antitoxin system PIN domain toxin